MPRGKPSSHWHSLILQRPDEDVALQQRPRGRRAVDAEEAASAAAAADTSARVVYANWVHATRPILLTVDSKTGVWLVDLSMRGGIRQDEPFAKLNKKHGSAAATVQQQNKKQTFTTSTTKQWTRPTTDSNNKNQQTNGEALGEIYYRGIRKAEDLRRASVAASVQPHHCGFLHVGNAIAEAIVQKGQEVEAANKKPQSQQQQQQQQKRFGRALQQQGNRQGAGGKSSDEQQANVAIPVGAMATMMGVVMAFGVKGLLNDLRWFCDASCITDLQIASNVVPKFLPGSFVSADGSITVPSSSFSSGSKRRSAPFCFALAWSRDPNVLYVCFAYQEETVMVSTTTSLSQQQSEEGEGKEQQEVTTTATSVIAVHSGPCVRIAGASEWNPFASKISCFAASTDAFVFSNKRKCRLGWVARGRELQALTVDVTATSVSANDGLSGGRQHHHLSIGDGAAEAEAAARDPFSPEIEGEASAHHIGDENGMAGELQPGSPTAIKDPLVSTPVVHELPFLFFSEVVPCICELGPFAIDLDSSSSSSRSNGHCNNASTMNASGSNAEDDFTLRPGEDVLRIPRTRIDTAVLVTRGARARIFAKKIVKKTKGSGGNVEVVAASTAGGIVGGEQQQQQQQQQQQRGNHQRSGNATAATNGIKAVAEWFDTCRSRRRSALTTSSAATTVEPLSSPHRDNPREAYYHDTEMTNVVASTSSGGSCIGSSAAPDADNDNPSASTTMPTDDEEEVLECVCEQEVPGGNGYIKSAAVSPSGTVIAFGFESGIIVIAVCGAARRRKKSAAASASTTGSQQQHQHQHRDQQQRESTTTTTTTTPRLLFVAQTMCRTPNFAPTRMIIDERRACILCLDCTGVLEVLLFPADLRRNANILCSSTQRICAAGKAGPLDAPLLKDGEEDGEDEDEDVMPIRKRPMRTADCVGRLHAAMVVQQQNMGNALSEVLSTAGANHSNNSKVDHVINSFHRISNGSAVDGSTSVAVLPDELNTPEAVALKLCSQLEHLESQSFCIAYRSAQQQQFENDDEEGNAAVRDENARRFHQQLAARIMQGSGGGGSGGGAGNAICERNTAAAGTLDTHFFEGNYAPQFNPYTCVTQQDIPSGGGIGGGKFFDAAQLLSVVEAARAQAFARSAPSLAPSTVAAKFRLLKETVAARMKKFQKDLKKKKERTDTTTNTNTATGPAINSNLTATLKGSSFASMSMTAAASSAGGAAFSLARGASSAVTAQFMPWKAVTADGVYAARPRLLHEQVAVDADSVHAIREELALARYLVSDEATSRYCSPFSIPP